MARKEDIEFKHEPIDANKLFNRSVDPVALQREIEKVNRDVFKQSEKIHRELALKNNIINFFGYERFADELKQGILDSEHFYFADEDEILRAGRNVGLTIKMVPELIQRYIHQFGEESDSDSAQSDFIGFATNFLMDEVVSPLSQRLFAEASESEEIQELIKNSGVESEKTRMIFSSMYLINGVGGVKRNVLTLSLFA